MLNKINLFFALILFSTSLLYSQTRNIIVTGNVSTVDGRALKNINVVLQGTRYKTLTNSNGSFRLEVPSGKYKMLLYSYTTVSKEIDIDVTSSSHNDFSDIVLEEKSLQLDEVVVTGDLSPQSLQNSIYKVKVINSQEIEQKGADNMQTLLNTEIGVRISNDMALGETDFEIMGMGGNNVKVLLDGIPMIDRFSNKQSLSQIDVSMIERVEIVEGPMSVIYGSDALAGVINIITKKSNIESTDKLSLNIKVQEESLGQEYDFFINKGNHIQNININYSQSNGFFSGLNFSHNAFGGWQGNLPGRKKEWPSKEQYLSRIQLGLDKKEYSLIYKLDYVNENILKQGNVPLNQKALDEEFLSDRFTHQLQGNWQQNKNSRFELALSYQNYQRDKKSTVLNFITGERKLSDADDAQDETEYSVWFGRLTNNWKILPNLSLLSGLELQQNQGIGDKIEVDNNRITNSAVFLSAEYSPIDWLHIRPGVRSTFNSKYDAPLAIPSIILKARLNKDIDVRLSYASGFRAPTLQELYYTFYHTNGGGFWIKGNPDLIAEKSNSYIASFVWQAVSNENILYIPTLSCFYSKFNDRIQMVQSAKETSLLTYYNSGKYETLGATIENSLAWKNLKLNVNLSYIGRYNNLYDDENYKNENQERIWFSPEISTSLTYDLQDVVTFNLFYKFTGSRQEYQAYNEKLVLGGLNSYHWADLTLSRTFFNNMTVVAGVKNIFGVTTVGNTINNAMGGHNSSAVDASLLGCGRSYFIGISYNFSNLLK